MKNAEDYFKKYGNRHLMIDYSSLSRIITEHDNEIISEIEKKMEKLEESRSGGRLTGAALAGVNITIIRLTEIINLIKEK